MKDSTLSYELRTLYFSLTLRDSAAGPSMGSGRDIASGRGKARSRCACQAANNAFPSQRGDRTSRVERRCSRAAHCAVVALRRRIPATPLPSGSRFTQGRQPQVSEK